MSEFIIVSTDLPASILEVSTPGPQGSSGTVSVGTVTTGAAGSSAAVTNSGTPSAAVFNFTIPKGDVGDVTPEATAAKNQAVAAASAAAASELAAETAEQAAEDSAAAALASANQASASAATATTKASQASTSASNAAASAQSAESAATTATNKANQASASAAAALSSANTATAKAQEAAASATSADAKAQEAVVSAATATNKAQEASSSAATALSAQEVTTDNATLSIAQAAIATTKAAEASASASTANTKAILATDKATEATQQAVISTEQAGVSTAQATISSTQAGISTTQANAAIAQANIATTKASEASVSALDSQDSASAALASQVAAAVSAGAANTSAGNASGSAASALAIYGTTAAQQAALTNAQSAASLAQGYALSASSAVQQDLTGVAAAALHRSPNAVTAMFVYDTSKDSDGGAWTERCQHTSWYNEALNGKWLGAHDTENAARAADAILTGPELIVNGTFDSDISGQLPSGWSGTSSPIITVANGVVTLTNGGSYSYIERTFPTVIGKTYKYSVNKAGGLVGIFSQSPSVTFFNNYSASSGTFVATSTTTYFRIGNTVSGLGAVCSFDNISVREVTAITAKSGDYYQSTVDGKFYRLNPTSGVTETFRGNKADFPRLAGIVAEALNVTIYDLTEAGRPMWMRFLATGGGAQYMLYSGVSGLYAQNGYFGVAPTGGYGVFVVNFPKDAAHRHYTSSNFVFANGIAGRNTNLTTNWQVTTSYTGFVPSNNINAVAMTVLPDAPVDPVTGLQVPTIAVGTNGGVSVIKHNGTVVKSGFTYNFVGVSLSKNILYGTTTDTVVYYATSPGSLTNSFTFTRFSGVNRDFAATYATNKFTQLATDSDVIRSGNLAAYVTRAKFNRTTNSLTTSSRVSPTFNTGHLIGDIRRAYLADVDVGSASGPELVTNGTFDTAANWTLNANWTVSGGTISSTTGGSATTGAGSTVVGKCYRYSFDLVDTVTTGTGASAIYIGDTPVFIYNGTTAGTKTGVVYAATTGGVRLFNGSSHNLRIDNVSVREAVADRSYKAQAASITGTLTKTQVALAAQTVSYSGFSAANYLREPYSADLDFGTGEWSASAWVNVPGTLPVGSFPVVGSELVTNGTFDTDTTGWTSSGNGTQTISVTGGQLVISSIVGGWNFVSTQISTVAGKTYVFSIDLISATGGAGTGGSLQAGTNVGNAGSLVQMALGASGTKRVLSFVASGSVAFVWFATNGAVSTNVVLDNASVKEVTPSMLADRAHSSGSKINIGLTALGFLTATAFDGTTTRTVTTTAAYNTATWIKPEAVYTTDGTLAIRVNGAEVAAARGAPLLTLNNSNAVLTIGNSYALDAAFPGSIALLKLSATVPTAEQSQWMYEQEKQMFREGAQVTLPDSGNVVDLAYDDLTDKWLAVSATNESEWSGLVRTSVTASPAGSYSKIAAASGVQLQARTTTNPGVDVTIPSYGLREELVNRSQAAARLARTLVSFDYVGGFTANTTSGSTAITSIAGITYPVSYIGARVTGSGIAADTFVTAVSTTTIYLSKAATATATAVQISFNDFILPSGYETKDVLLAGVSQREGTTQAFVKLFDGFKETVRFNTSPLYTALVQIKATRSIQ